MTAISKIKLLRFRNYSSADFEFPQHVTCIAGPNGAGKTNLLDAIYYLCFTKSYFSGYQQHCIQSGHDGFRVTGVFSTGGKSETISCKWQNGKKEVFADGIPYEKITDHIGRYSAVMIAPDDIDLINGAGELRRKWIDGILGQADRAYLEKLFVYQRVLVQRNAWLKMHSQAAQPNQAELEYYNLQLAAAGTYIFQQRKRFLEQFLPLLNERYRTLLGNNEQTEVTYTSHLAQHDLQWLLERNMDFDLRYQRTSKGIHKDDWEFRLNDMTLRQFGSQGQKKSFLFALKLAQYSYLSDVRGHKPILLLDDIFEKLDQSRMEALLGIIGAPAFGQVIVTDTHPDRVRAAFGANTGIGFISL